MLALQDVLMAATTLDGGTVQPRWLRTEGEWHITDDSLGSCMYGNMLDPTVPSCIAGHIVFALDPAIFAEIAECEGVIKDVIGGHGSFADDAVEWLNLAQNKADNGYAWEQAIESASRTL